MYDLLANLTASGNGIEGNYGESLVTMKSPDAIKFGVLSWLEYTGVVFNDASFFQKGIAARAEAVMPGYILAAVSWFAIPWALATTAVSWSRTPEVAIASADRQVSSDHRASLLECSKRPARSSRPSPIR